MAPERTISAGTRSGAGDSQRVEAPWPLIIAQTDANNKYKPTEDTKKRGITRTGEEETRRKGGQEAR